MLDDFDIRLRIIAAAMMVPGVASCVVVRGVEVGGMVVKVKPSWWTMLRPQLRQALPVTVRDAVEEVRPVTIEISVEVR